MSSKTNIQLSSWLKDIQSIRMECCVYQAPNELSFSFKATLLPQNLEIEIGKQQSEKSTTLRLVDSGTQNFPASPSPCAHQKETTLQFNSHNFEHGRDRIELEDDGASSWPGVAWLDATLLFVGNSHRRRRRYQRQSQTQVCTKVLGQVYKASNNNDTGKSIAPRKQYVISAWEKSTVKTYSNCQRHGKQFSNFGQTKKTVSFFLSFSIVLITNRRDRNIVVHGCYWVYVSLFGNFLFFRLAKLQAAVTQKLIEIRQSVPEERMKGTNDYGE